MTVATVTDNSGTTGAVNIQWNDGNQSADWYGWRIYGKPTDADVWTLMYETFFDQTNYSYDLYHFLANVEAEYSVVEVTQPASGELVEEAFTHTYTVTATGDHKFWLIDAFDNAKNVELQHVRSFPHSLQYEQADYHLIGRGRKSDVGDRLGYEGSISGRLQEVGASPTSRVQKMKLAEQRSLSSSVYLRTPFGETYQIQISGLQFTPIAGLGYTQQIWDYSFNFKEVGGVPLGFG